MRAIGTFPQPFNYEVDFAGLLDARMFCPSYADLLTFTSSNYLINGFPVFVWDTDPSLVGCYQLIDNTNLSNPSSWHKVGSNIGNNRTPLQITDGSIKTITWATDSPPDGGTTYLARYGAFPNIVEENKADDGTWTPNGTPSYKWDSARAILTLTPQTTFTNFIIS